MNIEKQLTNGKGSVSDLSILVELNTELAVIDSKKLAKISERMKEMDRANLSFNKKNTQTTSQLMSLTMMCDAPYRRLRQVLAQIEKKRFALEDAAFDFRKKKLELREFREKDDELSQIEADELENQIKRNMGYLEGSLKELAMYQETYDDIKESLESVDPWMANKLKEQ